MSLSSHTTAQRNTSVRHAHNHLYSFIFVKIYVDCFNRNPYPNISNPIGYRMLTPNLYTASEKKDRRYFGRNLDRFRQLFIIFGTNYTYNPCDWKIVKCPINTCTTLRNDDVNVTSQENRVRGKKGPTVLWTWLWQIQIYSCNFLQGISWRMRNY